MTSFPDPAVLATRQCDDVGKRRGALTHWTRLSFQ